MTRINNLSLRSIVKVEKEEFQEASNGGYFNGLNISDLIARKQAKIFTDPVVIVQRLKFENGGFILPENDSETNNNSSKLDNANVVKEQMKLHMKLHENRWFCDLCPKTFIFKKIFVNHMISHRSKSFSCNVCDYKSKYRHNLRMHKLMHAETQQCKVCHKQVTDIEVHMKMHEPKVNCLICKKTVGKLGMMKHLKIYDNKRCKGRKCPDAFGSAEELRRHQLKRHFNGKLQECHCGSVFKNCTQLTQHQAVHVKARISCEVYDRQFKHSSNLCSHWNKTHLKTLGTRLEWKKSQGIQKKRSKLIPFSLDDQYICDKCGSTCLNRVALLSHMNRMHKRVPFLFCDLCPRSFYWKSLLINHMKSVHTILFRPFICDVCPFKTYTTSSNLKRHKLRHGKKLK